MPKSKCCNSEYLAVYSNTEETEYVCYACDHVCDITNPTSPTTTVEEIVLGVWSEAMRVNGLHDETPTYTVTEATQAIQYLISQAELRGENKAYRKVIDIFDQENAYEWITDEIENIEAKLTQLKGGKDNE